VVYVDIDPVAVAHSRDILTGNPLADVVQADLRDVAAILDDPRTKRLLDPTQPIGVLMVAILHFIPDDDDPASIIAQYHKMMAPGATSPSPTPATWATPTRSGHSPTSTGTPPPR
jgi:hypothetical protein